MAYEERSKLQTIQNNLRMLSSAANLYLLEHALAAEDYHIAFDDIVGPGKTIESLDVVSGEDYRGIVFEEKTEQISVTTSDGETITYSVEFALPLK